MSLQIYDVEYSNNDNFNFNKKISQQYFEEKSIKDFIDLIKNNNTNYIKYNYKILCSIQKNFHSIDKIFISRKDVNIHVDLLKRTGSNYFNFDTELDTNKRIIKFHLYYQGIKKVIEVLDDDLIYDGVLIIIDREYKKNHIMNRSNYKSIFIYY